jgi:hypothetical protein
MKTLQKLLYDKQYCTNVPKHQNTYVEIFCDFMHL